MGKAVYKFELMEYRDAGMPTYTYFWTDNGKRICSPYFDSQKEALDWMNEGMTIEQKPAQKTVWVTDCE